MNVGIVAGVVVDNDAISSAVAAQASVLTELTGIDEVTAFSQHFDRPLICPTVNVASSWQLASHPRFRSCDLVIFHWGIYYNEFDALTLLTGDIYPRPVVHFHNCTPRELVHADQHAVIDRSMMQFHHSIALGVPLWAVSEYNRQTLIAWGAADANVKVVPFPIPYPAERSRLPRNDDIIEMISVGRFVPAKGQHVIIDAVSRLPERTKDRVRVRLVGSRRFSDSDYVDKMHDLVGTRRLTRQVLFVDDPPDDELWRLYRSSDVVVIASAHEGLCVPIIEGYAVGCRAIGTTAGNIPNLLVSDDEMVEAGDPDALAAAMTRAIDKGKVIEADPARLEVAHRYSMEQSIEVTRAAIFPAPTRSRTAV
jgi:glycosyltransferase involved in cell wall biosynthesis